MNENALHHFRRVTSACSYVRNQRPAFPDGLLVIETPHLGCDRVWFAGNVADAALACAVRSEFDRTSAARFKDLRTVDALRAALSADLLQVVVWTYSDFCGHGARKYRAEELHGLLSLDWLVRGLSLSLRDAA